MDGDLPVASVRNLVVALWRQVARDVGSRSPARRAEGVAFLMSEQATVWAYRYDPACDPDIVIQAILVSTRHVRHTRHTAATARVASAERVPAAHAPWEPCAPPARR